ncbi:MAG TPA: MFS transporter, partial [Candidatus Limnocylindrales bacterium]|nr:MFS transporter [Candidatus Limnocylindrales bacterium]
MSSAARAVMLAALCLGVLLVGIELFITAVALPRIIADLSGWTDLRRASWIITVYLIAYIAATPLAGRAADRYGLPQLMIGSLGLFALGSLLCGAAQSLDQMVVARAIQGAGAGAIVPLAT